MIIDCETCLARDQGVCGDCVVSFLLHEGALELGEDEAEALEILALEGLVPQLRLIRPPSPGLDTAAS
jgi:hypothetical protein